MQLRIVLDAGICDPKTVSRERQCSHVVQDAKPLPQGNGCGMQSHMGSVREMEVTPLNTHVSSFASMMLVCIAPVNN